MDLATYLTVEEADELAASLPNVAAYLALADDDAKAAALAMATFRVDNGMRYQGRKYDASQVLEFPRVPYGDTAVVWDWDTDADEAVVPPQVKIATLLEASEMIDGARDRIANAIASGLTGQSTNKVSEQYRSALAGQTSNDALCRGAMILMERYRLKTGGIR